MTSTDCHLRRLIKHAAADKSHSLIDDAFAIIQEHFDGFADGLSPEVLVSFAEAASDLRGREAAVIRALELYDRLRCEDDQFKVRALLIRCVYEARLGSEALQLKGLHLLQQLQYALRYLAQALGIASKASGGDGRYGFLVYNASLVFWGVARPMCRMGWQRHIVDDTSAVLDALKAVSKSSGSSNDKGKGGPGGAAAVAIPVAVDPAWIIEMLLNLAFGLEDAGKDNDAQAKVNEANQMLDPELEARDPQLRALVLSARAHFSRKQSGVHTQPAWKNLTGTVFFVCNGAIPKENCEEELIRAWSSIDTEFDLREAKDRSGSKSPAKADADKGGARNAIKPQQLIELAQAVRAACFAECWAIAQPMLARCERFPMPAGRGRILLDLAKAEVDVWHTCNVKCEDPVSKMLLSQAEQHKREVDMRSRGVRLCEQCIMTAKRVGEIDLVEESAVVMWNLGMELMCNEHRLKIHKSLQKCSEILDEIQSVRLVQLRVQLHFEVALCEFSQDLLTKGRAELQRAQALDYTVSENELGEATSKHLNEDGGGHDPAPYVRRFDEAIEQQLHLLHWKLNLYEEPADPADQVMLLLDQVHKQGAASGKVTLNLLVQGLSKLESALDELLGENMQSLSETFEPPMRVITSDAPLRPLPHQAPATVKEGGSQVAEVAQTGQPILDQRPKSKREEAVQMAKRIVMLMCKIGLEAHRVEQPDFAIRACDRVLATVADGSISFGPPPIEVEGALLLADVAYTKALCLSGKIEHLGTVNGIDDEIEEATPPVSDDDAKEDPGSDIEQPDAEQLTAEEKASAASTKRELIKSLLYGMEKSHEFKQWWMVTNGLIHWWNLHLGLVKLSHEQPKTLTRVLKEYRDGLQDMQRYFWGEAALPDSDFNHALTANLMLAHLNSHVAAGQLNVLETDRLMVLRRLGPHERKALTVRTIELCKGHEAPLPDLAKLRPERLDAQPGGGAAPTPPAPKKGAAPPPPPVATGDDKADLQGNEADVMMAVACVPYAKDAEEAKKYVEQATAALSRWEPRQSDESMLTLWVELWTRLGRQCLGKPMHPNVGAKYALMCGIKGLGEINAAIPKYASQERMRWRGACHALCGEVFVRLVDPQKQEKESLVKLRRMSVEQFERCCEYAVATSSMALAVTGATSLWNVAMPLLHSAETRQLLIEPLHKATRALAAVQYQDDPHFFVGLYASLFDCHSDAGHWDKIHEVLNEAFRVIPPSCQRRLWALRMLALSRQGKNVAVAMGKMKESQAKPQAMIWLVLAGASSKQVDQADAYMKAAEILQAARQPDVVEVRMQFADWLLRNGFDPADAKAQLVASADALMDLEEGSSDEDEAAGDSGDGGSALSESDAKSVRSRKSASRYGSNSEGGTPRRRMNHQWSSVGKKSSAGGKRSPRSSTVNRRTSMASSSSKKSSGKQQKKLAENDTVATQLQPHNCEALCRVYTMQARLGMAREVHSALLGAAYFVVRFFGCTVEMANYAAQELSSYDLTSGGGEKEKRRLSKGRAMSEVGGRRSSNRRNEPQQEASSWQVFALPGYLADWACAERCPWQGPSAMMEILQRAEQMGIVSSDACTWATRPEAFPQPSPTFHSLVHLEDTLEEHGYHLWVFPVLEIHLQLAGVFGERLSAAVACFVHLRRCRFASQCKLVSAAGAAKAKWSEMLLQIPDSFGMFGDELEQARNQRSSRSNADGLDPDFVDTLQGPNNATKKVSAPWSCGDLHAYEVWAELSKECLLHGELWMACTLADEATKHALVHGDRRTLRKLQVTRASLAHAEGQHAQVISVLKDVATADLEQTVQIATLLSDAYRAKRQPVLADEVLEGALSAVGKDVRRPSSMQILAECTLHSARLHVEMARLCSTAVASRDWLSKLDAALQQHADVAEQLDRGALHSRRVSECVRFCRAAAGLLEARQLDLARDPSSGGGVLDMERLAHYADELCEAVAACRTSRDALLFSALPVEGPAGEALLPAEVLAARLDVWEARLLAMRRDFRHLARSERGRHTRTSVSPNRGRDRGDESPVEADHIDAWLKNIDNQILETERVRSAAREMTEVEASVASVCNAVTVLQTAGQEDAQAQRPGSAVNDAADAAPSDEKAESVGHPYCLVDALVELGRLQLELAAQNAGPDVVSKWDMPGPDMCEIRGMEVGERYSYVYQSKDMATLFKMPGPADDAEEPGADTPVPAPDDSCPFEEVGKATLCTALRAAFASRHFAGARRALLVMALDAYGKQCPEATFEFLIWLQSTDVCSRAADVFAEVLPEDHRERVQMHQLGELEERWAFPEMLDAYCSTKRRLQAESPLFQRLQLDEMPAISDLVLTHLPPLTLVVTLQLHRGHLYAGAACSPAEGEPDQRAQQVRHLVMRVEAAEPEVHARLLRMQELNLQIEKELLAAPELNDTLAEEYAALASQLDALLVQPVAQELACYFWQDGIHVENPTNPRQLVLLPDSVLWRLPLEHLPSLLGLFGPTSHAALSRDFSLHLAARRVRKFVEDGDRKPLKPQLPAMRSATTVLLTDAFNDDVLRPGDEPKSEVMYKLHKRLVDAKVVGNEKQSLHGQICSASAEDIKGMLADSSAFYSLGFSRFSTIMNARHFASQDLRHVAFLGLFHRSINDSAFRRQTKTDSMKTPTQLGFENAYGMQLIASFRGAQCTVMACAPVPTALNMRGFEVFARALHAGKTVAKALEEMLSHQVDSVELRYTRLLEGGVVPGGDAKDPKDAKDAKGKGSKAETPAPDAEPREILLPAYTRSAYMVVGVPWLVSEGGAAPDGGKKK